MTIKEELAQFKKEIDVELALALDRIIAEMAEVDRFSAQALRYFKKTLLADGKRIRPILLIQGYLAAGGRDRAEIIKTSASVELIHGFLLMHDDIIDRDDVRHGLPTMHAHYSDIGKKKLNIREHEHFSISIAIVIADMLNEYGNRILQESCFPSENILRALSRMRTIITLTGVGEIQDVCAAYKKTITKKNILSIYENKTARYTFEGPLHIGALLAGADQKFLQKLTAFAVPLGIAFQIQDDILGIFGDEKKIGKPVGSDIAEEKQTLLTHFAQKKLRGQRKRQFDKLLGKGDIKKKEVEEFRSMIVETGTLEKTQSLANDYLHEAENAVAQINTTQSTKEFFEKVIRHLKDREV